MEVSILDSMHLFQDNYALKLDKSVLKSDTFDYPGKACAQLGNAMLISDAVALIPGYAALKSDMEVLILVSMNLFQDNVALKLDKSVHISDTFIYPRQACAQLQNLMLISDAVEISRTMLR